MSDDETESNQVCFNIYLRYVFSSCLSPIYNNSILYFPHNLHLQIKLGGTTQPFSFLVGAHKYKVSYLSVKERKK